MDIHTIPCKRPKVTMEAVAGLDLHLTRCGVPGCTWTYGPGLKTDVEQQTTWHRKDHRAAVPKTMVGGPTVNLGYFGTCACGWKTARGVVTRTEVEASIAYHLHHDHGLVSR